MRKFLFVFALPFLLSQAAFAQGPAKTEIKDTLYSTLGLVTGTLRITNQQTFTTPDGFVIASGVVLTYAINGGAIDIFLPPNNGSTPAGTSYTATYTLANTLQSYTETWVVPNLTLTSLSGVRALAPPIPSPLLSASQLVPPAGCTAINPILSWTGTSWTCAGVPGSTSLTLENPQVTDSGKFQWTPKLPLTPTRIYCNTDSGTVSINLDERLASSPNTAGTSVLAAPLTCTPTSVFGTSFSLLTLASEQPIALMVTATSGSPGVVRVTLEY